jgi:energy-coupling factor transporter ATP-binding protein EcfA2
MTEAIDQQGPAIKVQSNIPDDIQTLKLARDAGGLDDEGEKIFQEFRSKYPEYFSADTPLEKQKTFFQTIKVKQRLAEEEKIQSARKLDDTVVKLQKERETKAKQQELSNKAVTILKTGKPMDTFRKGYYLNHCGDDEILRAIIYARVLQSSRTTKGLQVFITGDKGSGKSSAVKSAVNLIPPEKVSEGSFSDKAFFLKLEKKDKPVVYLDDITLTESQVATIKRAMTNFQRVTEHNTIVEHKLVVIAIPARSLWLGSAVSETGDDQLKDRFLMLGIQNSPESDKEYVAWELQRRKEGRSEYAITEDVNLSRAMLQHINEHEFVVAGVDWVEFTYTSDRRLINICLDLMEANAILHYHQREHEEKDGVIIVHPVADDLNAALDFSMFRFTDKNADGRLTKAERALDNIIQDDIGGRAEQNYFETRVVELFGKSVTRVRTLLYGRNGTSLNIKGGLLEKAPWYSLDVDQDTRKNVIRVKKHKNNNFAQFARITR